MNLLYTFVKKPFVGSYRIKWRSPLSEIEKQEWQTLTVKSRSGGTIRGLFAQARAPQARATLVLAHPMGKEAKGYFIKHGYTDILRANGYNTLVFDINGFGESTNGSFSYHEDILAIGQVARKLTPTLPLGYHGISLGAQWAIIAFTNDEHPFRFAILESAPATVEEFWIKFPAAYRMLRFLNVLLPRYARKIKPVERIKEVKNLESILFIYSQTDDYTPVEMGERLKANSPVPAELWTVHEAPHAGIAKSSAKAAYTAKIIDYFNKAVSRHNQRML